MPLSEQQTYKDFRTKSHGVIDTHEKDKEEDKTPASRDMDHAREDRWNKSEYWTEQDINQFYPDRWRQMKPDNEVVHLIYPVEANMLSINTFIRQAEGTPEAFPQQTTQPKPIPQTALTPIETPLPVTEPKPSPTQMELGPMQSTHLKDYLSQLATIAFQIGALETPAHMVEYDFNGQKYSITTLPEQGLLPMIQDMQKKITEHTRMNKQQATGIGLTLRLPNGNSPELEQRLNKVFKSMEEFFKRIKNKSSVKDDAKDILDTTKEDKRNTPEGKENPVEYDTYPPGTAEIPAVNEPGLSPLDVGISQKYFFGL